MPILCVHAAVFGWLISDRNPPERAPSASHLTVFEVAPDRPPNPPAVITVAIKTPTVLPPPIVNAPPAIPVISVSLPLVADQSAILPGGCDLTDVVQTALRADETARADLINLPASARSVANAIMLWDGRWVAGTPAGDAALTHVRAVVLDIVRNATPDCRSQLQAGPRLIAIPGPPDTVLAIGSGGWRWNDLTAESDTITIASNDPNAGTRAASGVTKAYAR